jgi:hypothetical protein
MAFLSLGCLLRWWKDVSIRWLLLTSVVISLGILTKANAYLFPLILVICIIFRPGTSVKVRWKWLWISGLLIAVTAGWLVILRYLQNDFGRLMAPGQGMSQLLNVPNSLTSFVVFDPIGVIIRPFANPWADGSGRQFFWMYFFQSSLFSEFAFWQQGLGLISRTLSALLLGSLLIALRGVIKAFRHNDQYLMPIMVTAIFTLHGALLYRVLHPGSANQDFRYSIVLIPILAYFAVRATEGNSKLHTIFRFWLLAFATCAACFLLGLSLYEAMAMAV